MQCDEVERRFEGRETKRSSVYIVGVLSSDGRSVSAKIRNLSATGALVEASDLPARGTPVRLARGSLHADGTVMWAAGGRCGIRFNSIVNVSQWVNPSGNSAQRRIDETVAALKSNPALARAPAAVTAPPAANVKHLEASAIARDLHQLGELINAIGAALMKEEALIERHGPTLQNLDIVTQTLDVIGAYLAGDLRDMAARERLAGLRVSRTEALERKAQA